jgi:hypothetical protein
VTRAPGRRVVPPGLAAPSTRQGAVLHGAAPRGARPGPSTGSFPPAAAASCRSWRSDHDVRPAAECPYARRDARGVATYVRRVRSGGVHGPSSHRSAVEGPARDGSAVDARSEQRVGALARALGHFSRRAARHVHWRSGAESTKGASSLDRASPTGRRGARSRIAPTPPPRASRRSTRTDRVLRSVPGRCEDHDERAKPPHPPGRARHEHVDRCERPLHPRQPGERSWSTHYAVIA